jgi:hypothetical protein
MKKNKNQKNLVRMANCILAVLLGFKKSHLKDIQCQLEDICVRSAEVAKGSRRFLTAVEKGWFCAAQQVIESIGRDISEFSRNLSRFRDIVNQDETQLPCLSDIVGDLSQIQREFDEFDFDPNEKTISVTTKPIVLDDIALGEFEIKLILNDFKAFPSQRPYRVIALNPNPASSDDGITHPHVSHEQLCEGDGHNAINRALEQGRFCDFFTMAAGVLENYNADSPHIPLSEWEGSSCYDCGRTIHSDESYYCECCDHDYCSHCSVCCQRCDTTLCLGCAYECPDCGEPVCERCTAVCSQCKRRFCKDCLNEGMCETCVSEREEQEYEQEQECESEPEPAVQSDSVG